MTTTIVHTASLVSSSVWFAMSVAALCIAIIIPYVKRRPPPIAPRVQLETPMFIRSTSQSSLMPSAQATVDVPKDGNYQIAVDSNAGVLRRSVVRRSAPSAITVVPPVSGAITIVARPDCPNFAVTATLGPPAEETQESESTFSHFDSQGVLSSGLHSEASMHSSEPSKKASLPQKVTSLFRRKSRRRSGETEKTSRSRSLSPIRKLLPDLKSEPEEPATAHGRIPYVRNPEDREVLERKFVNPFKRRSRNSRKGTQNIASPPTTASMGHQRHRSLLSYLNKAVRPLHDESRSPSPHRWSVSSFTSRSDASSSSASSRRSFSISSTSSPSASRSPTFSERSTHRTQPYGAPYYAAMPAQRPYSRRSSSARMTVELRQPISEGEEPQEEAPSSRRSSLRAGSVTRSMTVSEAEASEAARKRRHRSISIDDGSGQRR